MIRPQVNLRVDENGILLFVGIEGKAIVNIVKDGDSKDPTPWMKTIAPARGEQRKLDRKPQDDMYRPPRHATQRHLRSV